MPGAVHELQPDAEFASGLVAQRQQLAEHRQRPAAHVGLGFGPAHAFADPLGQRAQREGVQFGLGAEEVAHGAGGEPGFGRDLADGGLGEPAAFEGPPRGGDDVPPPRLLIDPPHHQPKLTHLC